MRVILRVASVLGAAAVAGVLGGWMWWRWWSPAHDGQVFNTADGPKWYPIPLESGAAEDFAATGQYVVLAVGLGLLLGVLAGVLARRQPLLMLGVAVLGSGSAAALMWLVGTWRSPSDPQAMAARVDVGTELPAQMFVSGWTPYLVWPFATLLGYLAVLVLTPAPRPDAPQTEASVGRPAGARDLAGGQ